MTTPGGGSRPKAAAARVRQAHLDSGLDQSSVKGIVWENFYRLDHRRAGVFRIATFTLSICISVQHMRGSFYWTDNAIGSNHTIDRMMTIAALGWLFFDFSYRSV